MINDQIESFDAHFDASGKETTSVTNMKMTKLQIVSFLAHFDGSNEETTAVTNMNMKMTNLQKQALCFIITNIVRKKKDPIRPHIRSLHYKMFRAQTG